MIAISYEQVSVCYVENYIKPTVEPYEFKSAETKRALYTQLVDDEIGDFCWNVSLDTGRYPSRVANFSIIENYNLIKSFSYPYHVFKLEGFKSINRERRFYAPILNSE